MTVNQLIRIFAGAFILISLALTHFSAQADLSQMSWLWFTAFVGLNLFQSGITGFCPPSFLLKKLGLKESGGACCS